MYKKWFTLVELIVVITILAILWTIAFTSLQWYARDARDTKRISDVWNIKKSLENFVLQTGKYPTPDSAEEITYSGWVVWYQWSLWDNVVAQLSRNLKEKPTDPLTSSEYTYSLLNTEVEYELWGVLEWSPISRLLPPLAWETYAAGTKATAYTSWNYNGVLAKVQLWWLTYILAIPAIISWDLSNTDVETILSNNKLVYNKLSNLPPYYSGTTLWENSEVDLWLWSDIILYSWSTSDLTQKDKQIEFFEKLKNAYSGSILKSTAKDIDNIVSTSTTSDEWGALLIAQVLINEHVDSQIEISAVSTATGAAAPWIVAQASAWGYHTCVVTTWGQLKCWGRNEYGQIGDGTTNDKFTPINILSWIQSVDLWDKHSCAITTTWDLKCWGENYAGKLWING